MAEVAEADPQSCLLPPQTREDMARVITSTRETVSRTLAGWNREGVISMRGRRIIVRDSTARRSAYPKGADAMTDEPHG
jgi:CRP-like cAMP-binding protein